MRDSHHGRDLDRGSRQDVRDDAGARRSRPRRSRPARCTASSGRTARARRRRSVSCSACSAPTAARSTLLGGDPWRDAVALHRRLAYVPGDVTLWPKLSGGEVIDLLGRLRGDLDPRRRDELLERFELDPTKKARTYSKGNRQKVGLVAALASRRRAAHPRRADVGPRPADGGRLPGLHPRGRRPKAAPCCCRATSSPRSRRSATGSASSAPAGPSRAAPCRSCAA